MTVDTHEIRLRGPWQVRLAGLRSPVGTVSLPGTLRFEDFGVTCGRVEVVRRFPWIAPRSADERIHLVLPDSEKDIEVVLNNRRIGQVAARSATRSLELTDVVEARNELVLRVDTAAWSAWVFSEPPALRIETQRGTGD